MKLWKKIVLYIILSAFLGWIGAILAWIIIHNHDKKLMETIEAADKEEPLAKEKILKLLNNKTLSSEKHNKLRKKWYLKKARKGDDFAQWWMGLLERSDNNIKQSIYWYEQSAKQGNTESMKSLAVGYCTALDNPVFGANSEKENYWLKTAAEAGDAEAQVMYARNCWIDFDDYSLAIYWFEKATTSQNPKTRIDAYKGLADVVKNPDNKETFNESKMEEYLLLALSTPPLDNETWRICENYSSPASTLASYYHRLSREQTEYLEKAAYCYAFAYFCDPGNEYMLKCLKELPFNISESLWKQWQNDARNLRFTLPN